MSALLYLALAAGLDAGPRAVSFGVGKDPVEARPANPDNFREDQPLQKALDALHTHLDEEDDDAAAEDLVVENLFPLDQERAYRAFQARSRSLDAVESVGRLDVDAASPERFYHDHAKNAATDFAGVLTTAALTRRGEAIRRVKADKLPLVAWVLGAGRSGSSLLQSLLKEAARGSSKVFVAFEPCHPEDRFQGRVLKEEETWALTRTCLQEVMKCNFDALTLGTGPNARTRRDSMLGKDDDLSAACKASEFMIVKTIDYVGDLQKAKRVLTGEAALAAKLKERVQLLEIRRDPRDIYVSRKRLDATWPGWAQKGTITPLCSVLVKNAEVALKDVRVQRVAYSTLVQKPRETMTAVLNFLGWYWMTSSPLLEQFVEENMGHSQAQGQWEGSVNKDYCKKQRMVRGPFSLCRTPEQATKYDDWFTILDKDEISAFDTKVCQSAREVAEKPELADM